MILNLTRHPVTLIADDGKTKKTIEPSGYYAGVEMVCNTVTGYPIGDNHFSSSGPCIPIVKETPTNIIVVSDFWVGMKQLGDGMREDDTNEEGWFGVGDSQHLLVYQEVAHAASALKHPLSYRMVWVDEKVVHHCDTKCPDHAGPRADWNGHCNKRIDGYNVLRCMP